MTEYTDSNYRAPAQETDLRGNIYSQPSFSVPMQNNISTHGQVSHAVQPMMIQSNSRQSYMPPNQQSIRPRQSNPQASRMNIPPQAPNVPVFIANTQQYPHIIMQQNPEMNQYRSSGMLQQYSMPQGYQNSANQAQQMQYYPQPQQGQVYIAAPPQYQVNQPRQNHSTQNLPNQTVPQQQPPPPTPYQPRERKIITITDDKGNDMTNQVLSGTKQKVKEPTPTAASNVTTETTSTTASDSSIAAEFAAKVAATLGDTKSSNHSESEATSAAEFAAKVAATLGDTKSSNHSESEATSETSNESGTVVASEEVSPNTNIPETVEQISDQSVDISSTVQNDGKDHLDDVPTTGCEKEAEVELVNGTSSTDTIVSHTQDNISKASDVSETTIDNTEVTEVVEPPTDPETVVESTPDTLVTEPEPVVCEKVVEEPETPDNTAIQQDEEKERTTKNEEISEAMVSTTTEVEVATVAAESPEKEIAEEQASENEAAVESSTTGELSEVQEPLVSSTNGVQETTPVEPEKIPETEEAINTQVEPEAQNTPEPLPASVPEVVIQAAQDEVVPQTDSPSKEESQTDQPHTQESASVIDDEDKPVIKTDKIELKYKYREDQWSPANPEGKRIYDRSFLLQFSTEKVAKPDLLPKFPDIVLPEPLDIRHSKNAPAIRDFTPVYMKGSPGRPMHPKNMKSTSRNKHQEQQPVRKITIAREEVKLHQSENAWVSGSTKGVATQQDTAADVADEEKVIQELYSKTRSILNKLTPQKFEPLKDQLMKLKIDTPEKLTGIVQIIFTTAIEEPAFAVAYAKLCHHMTQLTFEFGSFRKALLMRCQVVFETSKTAEADCRNEWQPKVDAATDAERPAVQMEMDYAMAKLRRRFLGNIRFIGELFKIKVLTEKIMKQCVKELLVPDDEEKLESLCKLMTTIGKDLDTAASASGLDGVFQQIRGIIESRQTSSRVRFMLQDVTDLRARNWVPRREDNNPKTIDQIHKDIRQEDLVRAAQLQATNLQPKQQGRRPSNQDRRGGSGGPPQQGEDGWQNVNTRTKQNILDPTKTKFTKTNVDDNVSFAPRYMSWGRGSSGGGGGGRSQSQEKQPSNRFMHLSKEQPPYDGGRGRSASAFRDSDRDQRGSGGGGAWGTPFRGNRGGMAHSMEQDKDSAIAAARSFSGRTPTGSRNASRESSRNRKSQMSIEREREREQATKKELTPEQMDKKTTSIIEEYFSVGDLKEAVLCVKELESPQTIYMFVFHVANYIIEHSDTARRKSAVLIQQCLKENVLTKDNFYKGISEILQYGEDYEIDIPKLWVYLGQFIGAMLTESLVPLGQVKECFVPLLGNKKFSGVLLAETMKAVCEKVGDQKATDMWKSSGLQWPDFLPQGQNVDDFVKQHNVGFTLSNALSIEALSSQLMIQLKSDTCTPNRLADCISKIVPPQQIQSPKFIRALVTSICTSALIHGTSIKIDCQKVKDYSDVLNKYIDHQPSCELQALFALQAFTTSLDHPSGLLENIFDTLLDNEVISEDAFLQWDADTTETIGKAIAHMSVTRFFVSLQEGLGDSNND